MSDLVERLRSHVACEGGDLADVEQAADELTRLRAEVEALRADAERYWWLRDPKNGKAVEVFRNYGLADATELDAAIDAARAGI